MDPFKAPEWNGVPGECRSTMEIITMMLNTIPESIFGFNLRSIVKNAPFPYLGQLIKYPQSTNCLIARHAD